jgi:hypothetical protein
MSEPESKGVATSGLILIARLRRKRARQFKSLAQSWRDDPRYDYVVTRRRRQRVRAYEALARGELVEAKRLEALAKAAGPSV